MYLTYIGRCTNIENEQVLYKFIHSYRLGVKTLYNILSGKYEGKKSVFALRDNNKDILKAIGVPPTELTDVSSDALALFNGKAKKTSPTAKLEHVFLLDNGRLFYPDSYKRKPSSSRNLQFIEGGFHASISLQKNVKYSHDIYMGYRRMMALKRLIDKGIIPVYINYIPESNGINVAITMRGAEPDYTPRTIIGVDIGERNIATLIAIDVNNPTKPMKGKFINGKIKEIRYRYYLHQYRMLKINDGTLNPKFKTPKRPRLDLVKNIRYKTKLNHEINMVAKEVVEYAKNFPDPIIVMEDLTNIRTHFKKGRKLNRRFHSLPFRKIQSAIQNRAFKEGIMVAYVDPKFTSQTCHRCGNINHVDGRTFVCNSCGMKYNRDLNASINIALRYLKNQKDKKD